MTFPRTVVALPARAAGDWRGRPVWGRDGHLLRALAHCAPDARMVLVPRTRAGSRTGRETLRLDGLPVLSVAHPMQVPGWTRRPAAARLARALTHRLPPRIPSERGGLVLCFDLLRHDAARALAGRHAAHLATDVMDDWREHPSMPAWHAHLRERVFPRLGGDGEAVTCVTALAVSPGRGTLVPNAGHHEDEPVRTPAAGPDRPVAAYVGTIHPRMDSDLLVRAARELPGWRVVAVGPVMDRRVAERLHAGGVTLVPWWDMAEIDRRATVLVAPYVSTRFARSGDPLKIYEATARGVPCVSTLDVSAPPDTGLAVTGADGFTEAVVRARDADRTDVMMAGRATGSWEDRARAVLEAAGAVGPPAATAA